MGTCEPLEEQPFIVWCIQENCQMTRWSNSTKWSIDQRRSEMVLAGYKEAFSYCPSHTPTQKTPRFDV